MKAMSFFLKSRPVLFSFPFLQIYNEYSCACFLQLAGQSIDGFLQILFVAMDIRLPPVIIRNDLDGAAVQLNVVKIVYQRVCAFIFPIPQAR